MFWILFLIISVSCIIGTEARIRTEFLTDSGIPCKDDCAKRGQYYFWCHTVNGSWDNCNLHTAKLKTTVVFHSNYGKVCLNSCTLDGEYSYCSTAEDRTLQYCSPAKGYASNYDVCTTACDYHGSNYQWCETKNGKYEWNYCSIPRNTYNGSEFDQCRISAFLFRPPIVSSKFAIHSGVLLLLEDYNYSFVIFVKQSCIGLSPESCNVFYGETEETQEVLFAKLQLLKNFYLKGNLSRTPTHTPEILWEENGLRLNLEKMFWMEGMDYIL